MKNRIKKLGLCVCLTASVTLTACGKSESTPAKKKMTTETKSEKLQEQKVQKGRYRETEVSFPKEIKTVFDVKKQDDGVIQILYESVPGSLYLAESSDKGKSWEHKMEVKAGELPNGYRAEDGAFRKDGSVVISAGVMSENPAYNKKAVGRYIYYNLKNKNGNMEARELKLDIPKAEGDFTERGYGLGEFVIAEDDTLYGTIGIDGGEAISEYLLVCLDLKDGALKWSKKTGVGDMKLEDGILYLHEYDRLENGDGWAVKKIDAATGEAAGALPLPEEIKGFNNVDFDMKNRTMFCCLQDGIYFSDLEMAFKEQLVDGRLSGFSQAGYHVSGLHVIDDKTMLLFLQEDYGGAIKALRYEYDPELPAVPDKELNVYSLKINSIMDKMVTDFRKENPDIMVNYEIGMLNGEQTVSDAISNLNTEIMAGNGPDVMVLNSLPWESYVKKGLLADVSGEIGALLDKGELYENLFAPYKKDDAWYAAPVSYKIPIVYGKAENIEGLSSLEAITKTVENSTERPAMSKTGAELLIFAVSTYWNTIQAEDGSISEEGLRNFLDEIKKINDRLMSFDEISRWAYDYDGTEDVFNTAYDIFLEDTLADTLALKEDKALMELGNLSYLGTYTDFYCYGFDVLPAGGKVFSPLLAGVSARARNTDSAKAFMSFMLGEKEQGIFGVDSYPIIGNLPVNRKAFEGMKRQPSENTLEEMKKIITIEGYDFRWPEEAYFKELQRITEGLSVPAMEDTVVCRTVLEHGYPYLKGEKDLDSSVNEIIRKLELYQAE